MDVLQLERTSLDGVKIDLDGMAQAAKDSDEQSLARAAGRPDEIKVAKSAGAHGMELLRLGYTLSHVVHAYGAMCQAITEVATSRNFAITTSEFHDLNRCLDIAIAGAVVGYQSTQNEKESSRELQHLGSLSHELRNALTSASVAFQMIKWGAVTIGGNTGLVLERSLQRLEDLIDRSLTEVRLHVDPKVHLESGNLLRLVDQIVVTLEGEAHTKNQVLEVKVDPALVIEVDQQLFHSALYNLIHNALKYTHPKGKILVRGYLEGKNIVVEVEDECGGLGPNAEEDLFKPFEQQNENKKGLGLGLTIARRAIRLNQGKIELQNLPEKGCIFKITLPQKAARSELKEPAA